MPDVSPQDLKLLLDPEAYAKVVKNLGDAQGAFYKALKGIVDALGIHGATQHLSYNQTIGDADNLARQWAQQLQAQIDPTAFDQYSALFAQKASAYILASDLWPNQPNNKKIYSGGIKMNAFPQTSSFEKLRITLSNIFSWILTGIDAVHPETAPPIAQTVITEISNQVVEQFPSASSAKPGKITVAGLDLSASLPLIIIVVVIFLIVKAIK